MEPDTFDQSQPRIGRRESEPHSLEVAYLHDVLGSNFPQHHALLDLHHYFQKGGDEIDVQFDISFFLDFSVPYTLSSYRASDYQDKLPVLAINIMSKSTWRADLSENLDICKVLGIQAYVVFTPFDVATKLYRPPFVRVYLLQPDGTYLIKEQRNSCIGKDGRVLEQHLVELGSLVPFRLGIEELGDLHERAHNRYRLVLVRSDSPDRLPTRFEREKQRAEKYLRLLRDHGIEP
ncbi:MAG: hypothetical protein JW839_08855 [Candidatus Lokiarchaeota archaeon]|nr:hypothetical protein [Candidatus Lokiarchaeota archaeon]